VLSIACGELDADEYDKVVFGMIEGAGGNAVYFHQSGQPHRAGFLWRHE
jgi:hypothetical protein